MSTLKTMLSAATLALTINSAMAQNPGADAPFNLSLIHS